MKRKRILMLVLILSNILLNCNTKSNKIDSDNFESTDTITDTIVAINEMDTIKPARKFKTREEYKVIYDSVVAFYNPAKITKAEFKNFKEKSNYSKAIEEYDIKNPIKGYGDEISYYDIPTEINTSEYGNNRIIFGDLNDDNKRDCIVIATRSNGYDEFSFFYVFINMDTEFKLVQVIGEDKICGCTREGHGTLRYQIIENGYLKGVTSCHYEDAHCCPSLYFRTKVKFINGKLQFHSAEFVFDDAQQYRPTPPLDSVLIKSVIN